MKLFNALLAASTAFVAGVTAIGDCDGGPFAKRIVVGDKHDASKFDVDICETQWKGGSVVKGVEVWGSKGRISGIQLTFSNDEKSHMIGARAGDYHSDLQWDPFTAQVKRAVLWSDWDARQLGGLRLELTDGRSLEMKQDKISAVMFDVDVGSGILLAGFGRADDHITAWGWNFLEDKVAKIAVGNFKFDQDLNEYVKKEKGIKQTVMAKSASYNAGTNATTNSIDVTRAATNSYSYSQSASFTFGMGYSLEISGQVAGAGPKATFDVHFEVTTESRQEWSKSETTTLWFKETQIVPPGRTGMCIGYVEFGEFDMGYDSTVTVTLKNKNSFQFNQRGVRKQTLYGGAQKACADMEGDLREMDAMDFIAKAGKVQKKEQKQARYISQPFKA